MIVGGSLGAKIFVFYVCVCVWVFGGMGVVLIKYTGKYVKIYFNMKITFLYVEMFVCYKNVNLYINYLYDIYDFVL